MKVAVGCPVYQRAWVLEAWFDHIEALGWDIRYVFAYTPSSDNTLEIIKRRAKDPVYEIVVTGNHSVKRNWGDADRLSTLAHLRNVLLDLVRQIEPDVFLSVDSDILMPENSDLLLEDLDTYDAVAPLVMLSQSGNVSNAFYQRGPKVTRRRVKQFYDAVMPVDVICAAKLITPDIFNDDRVEYGYHSAGEDIFWSNTAKVAGYSMALDPRVRPKHIMTAGWLEKKDGRIGW